MRIEQVLIFPVKGIAGESLDACRLLMHGFENDRRWMLKNDAGEPVKAKKYPKLRKIRVVLGDDGFVFRSEGYPDVKLEGNGQAVDAWLSDFLGEACRLVDVERTLDEHGGRVSFSHGYPVLLQSAESLVDVNSRLEKPVTMEHFRPNLVVSGCAAYEEDCWKTVRIGEVIFDVHEPCIRCMSTTIDPVTGVPDEQKEPFKTLAGYRSDANGDVLLGMYMSPRSEGMIRVGDEVDVLERQESAI